MKFRKKPVVIEATQWFTNGDHPLDNCYLVRMDPKDATALCSPFLSEGKVVRYYRNPIGDGYKSCQHCNNTMHYHGWIDTLEGGHIVCPGDWIITGIMGEHYPCKSDIFEKTYEKVEE